MALPVSSGALSVNNSRNGPNLNNTSSNRKVAMLSAVCSITVVATTGGITSFGQAFLLSHSRHPATHRRTSICIPGHQYNFEMRTNVCGTLRCPARTELARSLKIVAHNDGGNTTLIDSPTSTTAGTSFIAGLGTFVPSLLPVARVRRPRRAADVAIGADATGTVTAVCTASSCSVAACSTAIRATSASARLFVACVTDCDGSIPGSNGLGVVAGHSGSSVFLTCRSARSNARCPTTALTAAVDLDSASATMLVLPGRNEPYQQQSPSPKGRLSFVGIKSEDQIRSLTPSWTMPVHCRLDRGTLKCAPRTTSEGSDALRFAISGYPTVAPQLGRVPGQSRRCTGEPKETLGESPGRTLSQCTMSAPAAINPPRRVYPDSTAKLARLTVDGLDPFALGGYSALI
ncbi:unnamed protein product [Phytophthora fragariaefolia]|uniref:Unnamed protein product n=1 Tax=Phytophthora fragariaefolia TaxID=1490495 RepID=A0A9W6XYX9_9STRA|nr:unnamed protein product [Phytophthora fragariaefolia]